MMSLSSIFLAVYCGSLSVLSLTSQPILSCCVLLLSSFSVCGFLFFSYGLTWFVLLFGLVYVGGVFILFMFISVCSPKLGMNSGFSFRVLSFSFISIFFVTWGVTNLSLFCFENNSFYLCLDYENVAYCFLGCVMLIGLLMVSLIVSCKDSYYR